MDSLLNKLVPNNTKGKPTDIEHSIEAPDRENALDIFKRSYKRMLNTNIWHKLSGFASAAFVLTDEEGSKRNRLAQVGDHFQIDVPGPGPSAGDGYDWVEVEAIEDGTNPEGEEESFGMRVRSCKNPNKPAAGTAHFFTGDATSTFIIVRKGNKITASYHGRNEVLNIHTGNLHDTIRNAIAGTSAMMGISELQWSRLITSFLDGGV